MVDHLGLDKARIRLQGALIQRERIAVQPMSNDRNISQLYHSSGVPILVANQRCRLAWTLTSSFICCALSLAYHHSGWPLQL